MYPPSGPAGAAGGFGDPAAAAVRRKRRWSRPMLEHVHSSSPRPPAAENCSETTQIEKHTRPYPGPPLTIAANNCTFVIHYPRTLNHRMYVPHSYGHPAPWATTASRSHWDRALPSSLVAEARQTGSYRTPCVCRPGDSSGIPTRGQPSCPPQNKTSLHQGNTTNKTTTKSSPQG